jgi:hypothetical protein
MQTKIIIFTLSENVFHYEVLHYYRSLLILFLLLLVSNLIYNTSSPPKRLHGL